MTAPWDADFLPLPLLGNPHVQTMLGALLPGRSCPPPRRRHVVALPDGDALLLHENAPGGWRPGGPAALLLHGLTGCHGSPHVRRLAALLLARGARVFRADMRGAGLGLPLARRTYHAGRSDDVRAALGYLRRLCPESALLLLGVSMGGNIALKLAGEAALDPVPGLARVAAINPPIDLARCSELIGLPRNRVYERRFVRDLVRDALRRQSFFPDLPPVAFPRGLTLRHFDELYTAPRNGFAGVDDYYRRASSFALIERIAVPALILTARDDPFIAVEPFEELRVGGHVRVHILARGGHVGFVGWDGAGGVRWAERRVADWLTVG
jgi:predicted alpha/beta-fold hydrolase